MMKTMCKMRSIETNMKIEAEIVNIAKIDVVKTKFRAKKRKKLKIVILLIFQKEIVLNVVKMNIMFAIASFSYLLTNREKSKIDQCCFDCINSNCQRQKCFTSFFHFNHILYKHYHDYNKNDNR